MISSRKSSSSSIMLGGGSLVWKGTSPNSARVWDRDRVSNRLKNRQELHLWLWQTLAMASLG